MPRFKHYNYDQDAMVVINYQDQLQPGTFEHAVHYLIEHKLDLSVFHPKYRNDDTGRLAYDPAILLKIILFAYSKGITSSREMQWCCETNIIFKALSCDTVPHFTTLAKFVSSHSGEIEELFEQVLLVCHEQGLLGNELFAIDGCKMSSNAAKEWSGTFKELGEKREKLRRLIRHHLIEHNRRDEAETEAELDRAIRRAKTLLSLDESLKKVDRFLKTNRPRMGRGKRSKEVKSNLTDNESAKMTTSKGTIQGYNGVATVDKKHQIIIDAQAFGEGQEHHTLQPVLEKVEARYKKLGIARNIYQQGAVVTADTGFANEANMQYLHQRQINGYVPDNRFRSRDPKFAQQKDKYGKRHQSPVPSDWKSVIPASEFQFDPVTMTCICPAGEALRYEGTRTDQNGQARAHFHGRLLQCRHCPKKQQCMQNPESADHRKGKGRQVSYTMELKRGPTYTDWMKLRVDSQQGKGIYSHRMSVVEPVFGNIGTNKGLNRFSLRGKQKVQGQWQLYCLVHNIEKLANYGQLAA
ncbi:transposase [Hydrocarboniclastica marina]|uniref:IS1182 family transposase n=1 Tax=Hydrocarboniclastica marina TaxID=2259620 RepID=A0A4P7XEL5_9ALTE|nr:transposase [Hydrocarboniclastica marina]QCF24834.1 IS1182 family transposase [Hydrocarboniclastica marina]